MNELTKKRSIDAITAEIQFYKQQAGVSILEIGKRLIEAKEQLDHGEWLEWLEHGADISERMAQNFMKVSREYSNPKSISDLGVTKALALLSVPAEEREEFAEAVHAEDLSVRELKQKIREREDALQQAQSERDSARRELDSRQMELNAQIERSARLQQERQDLMEQLRELSDRPVEVATIDATDEQLSAAREQGRAFARDELEAVKRQRDEQVQMTNQLQTKLDDTRRELKRLREEHEDASEDVKINMSLGEINGLLREMQGANQRAAELLGNLDEVSRRRVQEFRRKMLKRMLEGIVN